MKTIDKRKALDEAIENNNKKTLLLENKENQLNASVAYKGDKYRCCIFGFPIECLTSQTEINTMIKQIIQFFEKNNNIEFIQDANNDIKKLNKVWKTNLKSFNEAGISEV